MSFLKNLRTRFYNAAKAWQDSEAARRKTFFVVGREVKSNEPEYKEIAAMTDRPYPIYEGPPAEARLEISQALIIDSMGGRVSGPLMKVNTWLHSRGWKFNL